MQLQKKRVWVLIVMLMICLAVLLLLLRNETTPAPQNFGEIVQTDSLTISSDELSALLRHELSNHLPLDSFEITLSPSGIATLDAELKKEDVIRLLEEQHSALRYAATVLPDPINAHLILRISLKENALYFEPTELRIADFDLTSLLTPTLIENINLAVSRYFDKKEIEILSFRVLSDAISMNIKYVLA